MITYTSYSPPHEPNYCNFMISVGYDTSPASLRNLECYMSFLKLRTIYFAEADLTYVLSFYQTFLKMLTLSTLIFPKL